MAGAAIIPYLTIHLWQVDILIAYLIHRPFIVSRPRPPAWLQFIKPMTMEYELQELDSLIEQLQKAMENGVDETLELRQLVSYQLPYQVSQLQKKLRASVSRSQQTEAAQLYIDQHARALSAHCQSLYALYKLHTRKADISNTPGPVAPLLSHACASLESALCFLRRQFPLFFDDRLPLPFCSFPRYKTDFSLDCSTIKAEARRVGITDNFVDVCLEPIVDFIARPDRYDYRTADYLQELCEQIIDLFSQPGADHNMELNKLLHSFNFNSPTYLKYCAEQIKLKFGNKTIEERRKEFAWYIKTMNQVPVRIGYALHPELPPVITSNTVWFKEEQAYLEAAMKIEEGFIDGMPASTKQARLPLKMGMKTACAIFKSVYDAGFLEVKSQNEGMQLFCKVVSTLGAEVPSFTSFSSNVFNLGQQSIRSAIDFHLKCVEALRSIE